MDTLVYFDNKVFNWDVDSESKSSTSYKERVRAYELWSHAESILNSKTDELHRVDAISTLKRCLNQRLKFIEYLYDLKKVSNQDSPKGYLEYLETFNLVRPLMLKKLMTIRNDIEHNDAKPPEIERCNELLDLTWYFLKSTDSIVTWQRNDIIYKNYTDKGDETQYWFSVSMDFELNHNINIRGWFPNNYIYNEETDNSTPVLIETIHTKQERWKDESQHNDKLDNDVYFCGIMKPNQIIKHNIINDILNTD